MRRGQQSSAELFAPGCSRAVETTIQGKLSVGKLAVEDGGRRAERSDRDSMIWKVV